MTKPSWHDEALKNQDGQMDPELAELEKKTGSSSSDFAKMLGESMKTPSRRLSPGDRVKGEILVLGREEVFVALGAGQDGVLERRELASDPQWANVKVGDSLDLFVIQVKKGEIRVSLKPTAKNVAEDLEDAFDMMIGIEGRVAEVCKGGFRVAIRGKLAFCPISQMDVAHITSPEEYVGKKFEFRITQFKEQGRDIVVSRRKLLEEEQDLAQGTFLEEKRVGDIVSGKVKKLEKFGAFVEIAPGVEGLLHVSELSWSRVADPSEVVSVGQDVKVKILKIENESAETVEKKRQEAGAPEKARGSHALRGRTRISLSLKQAGAQPWESLPSEVQVGQVVQGKVTKCMKFGAFVEVAPGIEGLVPLSEMSYTKRVLRPEEVVKEGDSVLVMIKEMRPDDKKVLLSIKDAGADPWALIEQKYPVGATVEGIVDRREAYGLFVKLEDGIVGLLPKSKALEVTEFNFDKYKKGDALRVQVAEVQKDARRISLSPPGSEGAEDWKVFSESQAARGAKGGGTKGGTFGNSLADKLAAALQKKK